MRRVALLACCAVLCVLIVADQASAQTPPEAPEAPATPTTTPRTNRISVNWTAAAGTGITAYDVRYIRADAPDKADANWTLVDPAWESSPTAGALTYRMDDLRDEIQVRNPGARREQRRRRRLVLKCYSRSQRHREKWQQRHSHGGLEGSQIDQRIPELAD